MTRDAGYAQGSVTLDYTTVTMSRDRGRGFNLDAMDVDESNFVATAAAVMGEFQRTQVVPEVDAYNLSALYDEVPSGNQEAYAPPPARCTANSRITLPRYRRL